MKDIIEDLTKEEVKQKKLYNSISTTYSDHFDDLESTEYRIKFIYSKLFKNIEGWENKKVLELMCGAGPVSSFLGSKTKSIVGLDISEEMIVKYNKKTNAKGIVGSILNIPFENETFDIAVVVGGLHHTHPELNRAINEVARVLKKGGLFLFIEPSRNSIVNLVRTIWYKLDKKNFESNESAIDVAKLKKNVTNTFSILSETYGGGPAYFIVYQSMFTKTPRFIKKVCKKPLFATEKKIEKYLPSWLSTYVVMQLKKI